MSKNKYIIIILVVAVFATGAFYILKNNIANKNDIKDKYDSIFVPEDAKEYDISFDLEELNEYEIRFKTVEYNKENIMTFLENYFKEENIKIPDNFEDYIKIKEVVN